MSLHLVETQISLSKLYRWSGARRIGEDEGLILHHLLGESFGPAALQPFRLMVAPGGRTGSLYAYAEQDAAKLRDLAQAVVTPDLADILDLVAMRSIPRPTSTWKAGQRLGFDVRLRPVVCLASDLEGTTAEGAAVKLRKGAETDAYLAAALRGQETDRTAVYLDWLASRLMPAAGLERETTRIHQFERKRVIRNGRKIEGPEIVVHGTLVVENPASFADLLAKGVGRHKAYGYGMLLLRPPQRRDAC